MNLQEAINALEQAVGEVAQAVGEIAKAALSDDRTPLGNAFALSQFTSSVGAGGDNPNVVILGDLNRLKALNNQFGLVVGDAAIGHVGGLIFKLLVEGCQAKAFRRSGDEFVILFSSTQLEKFKHAVPSFASCSFDVNGQTRETSMSFGYAVSEDEVGYDDLLSRAETACQVAKSKGKGVWVEWTEELERDAVDSLRDRCAHCNAIITCEVPRQVAPKDGRMLCCPCCGKSLVSNGASTPETQP